VHVAHEPPDASPALRMREALHGLRLIINDKTLDFPVGALDKTTQARAERSTHL
jgi:hypothetical protein